MAGWHDTSASHCELLAPELEPLRHVDPVGTIIILEYSGARMPLFGWANRAVQPARCAAASGVGDGALAGSGESVHGALCAQYGRVVRIKGDAP